MENGGSANKTYVSRSTFSFRAFLCVSRADSWIDDREDAKKRRMEFSLRLPFFAVISSSWSDTRAVQRAAAIHS